MKTQRLKLGRCFYCGTLDECTRDHFIPVSKGGRVTVPACQLCQMSKRDLMPLDFVEYMERHPAIKRKAAKHIRSAVEYLLKQLSNT